MFLHVSTIQSKGKISIGQYARYIGSSYMILNEKKGKLEALFNVVREIIEAIIVVLSWE